MAIPGFPEIEGRKFQATPESKDRVLQTPEDVKKEILRIIDDTLRRGETMGPVTTPIGLITRNREMAILGSYGDENIGGGSVPETKAPIESFLSALKEVMEEYEATEMPSKFSDKRSYFEKPPITYESRRYRTNNYLFHFETETSIDREKNEVIDVWWYVTT